MARPALQQVIGKPPGVQLQRLGADGKPHPLLVPEAGTGRLLPLTLSAAQGITMLASQTVAMPPGRQAVARTQATVDGGCISLAALTAVLDSPGANAVQLSGLPGAQDLGVALGVGEDPLVVALLAHVDDGGDVDAIRQSGRQVQADLQQIAGLARQGVLTGGLALPAQRAMAVAMETFLKQPDAPGLVACRERILQLAGGGVSAPFARALVRRLQTGCRLEMAMRALPAERRQAPPESPAQPLGLVGESVTDQPLSVQ
jgi:hypothetical protein